MKKQIFFTAFLLLLVVAFMASAGPQITQQNSYAPGAVAITGGTASGITISGSTISGDAVSATSGTLSGITINSSTIGATTAAKAQTLIEEVIIASSSSITANQVSGTILNNYGQVANAQHDLPTAAEGYNFTMILSADTAAYVRLKAAATDKIYLDGTAGADQGYIYVSSSTTGYATSCVTFQTGAAAYDWFCSTISGPWTAGP